MILFENFRIDGKIDWKAYHAAQIQDGEKCSECHRYTMPFPWIGHAGSCKECKRLREVEEVIHGSKVRCPYCGMSRDAFESGAVQHQTETPEIYCDFCEKKYTVSVRVLYEFTSPALIKKVEEEPE